jgi:AcrR family transcriptional regulator
LSSPALARLPAAERREALVETALAAFAAGSYRGVTTAEIVRRAGVSEPILYRHFASKRDLYLACIEEAWRRVRTAWERAEAEADPRAWLTQVGDSFAELKRARMLLWDLWAQALTEAADDREIRRYLRRHMEEVHDFLAAGLARGQASGVVVAERDPDAEAWIMVSIGLLMALGRRLGGLIDDDLPAILAARREWMSGVRPPLT